MIARAARTWVALVACALGCGPTWDNYFGCNAPTTEELEAMRAETAQAVESTAPLVGAGHLVMRDDGLRASWRAVEPGITGLKSSRGVDFPDAATEPFRYFFTLEAKREDTGEPRSIEVAVTFLPDAAGPRPIAIELVSVGHDKNDGGPSTTREFFACPAGGLSHYARFSPGDSPCHAEPLVPLVRCGCDGWDRRAPDECLAIDRTAVPKIECIRAEGGPLPK